MVSHATGNGKYEDINPDDRLAVNRFLNHGMNKTNTLDGRRRDAVPCRTVGSPP